MISVLEHPPGTVGPQRAPPPETWKAAAGYSHGVNRFVRKHAAVSESEIAVARERDRWDMARLASGDEEALRSLMERYSKKLLRHLEQMVRNHTDAEQLVIETFIRVFRHRLNYDFESRFSTWLYTIGSNLAISLLRWRARQPSQVPLPEVEEPEDDDSSIATDALVDTRPVPREQAETNEWTDALELALARLPENLRVALLLVALDGCSQAEVAERLGCSVKAVETRVYHARKRLRSEMDRILNPVRLRVEARMRAQSQR